MRCKVCRRDIPVGRTYCDRCLAHVGGPARRADRVAALRNALDREHDAFRCHFSGALLADDDGAGPFGLCFDRLFPAGPSDVVVASRLMRVMRSGLGPVEFRIVVERLAAHRRDEPFDRDCIAFTYWPASASKPSGSGGRPGRPVGAGACAVCGGPRPSASRFCDRCGPFVDGGRGARGREKALRSAWSAEEGRFSCHYTGAWVDDGDPANPWHLSFDRRRPGDDGTMVVAARWVVAMKGPLSEREFWATVRELDACWMEWRGFDRGVTRYTHWRRALAREVTPSR